MNEGTRLFPEDTEPKAIRIKETKHPKLPYIILSVAAVFVCLAGFAAYNFRGEIGGFFEKIPVFSTFGDSASPTDSAESETSESSESSSESESSVSQISSVSEPEPVPEPEPEPVPEPEPEPIPRDEWYMLLVNAEHPLSPDFSVTTKAIDTKGHLLDERVYDDFTAMIDAGTAEGLSFTVSTAYRTYEKQESLYNAQYESFINSGYDEAEAEKAASAAVAKPGTSEHNSGLAIDIVRTYGDFEGSTEQTWLLEHAYEYGFILRYPEDKTDITGFAFEPWHYRYVGKEQAKLIFESGLCLEEYLEEN